jgi:hypothetical protein
LRKKRPGQSILTRDDIKREIFIDYEGSKNSPPTLLGYMIDDDVNAAIVEPCFYDCRERYKAKHAVSANHLTIVKELIHRAEKVIRGRPGLRRAFEPSNLRATSLRYQARIVSGRATLATRRELRGPIDDQSRRAWLARRLRALAFLSTGPSGCDFQRPDTQCVPAAPGSPAP